MLQDVSLTILKFSAYYFISVNLIYSLLVFFSWIKIRKHKKKFAIDINNLPGVSFIVPAYNEEELIIETIQTYLSIPHHQKEVIIIDDGSHDKTMNLLKVIYQLKRCTKAHEVFYQSVTHPELKVIAAPHMGKATALNFGVQYAEYDIICTMDADTIPTSEGVQTCLQAFKNDPNLIAAGGIIQVIPEKSRSDFSKKWLTSFQRIEYLRTFICERLGWSILGSTILISGAFCMLKKEAIQKIGGFSPRSITEDFDLIVRLRKIYKSKEHQFKIFPVISCFTQVPQTLRHLSKQRIRWQLGLVQTLLQNSSLFMHPGHRILGLIAIPYFWFVEALSPFVSFLAYLLVPISFVLGWLRPEPLMFFIFLGLIFNILITKIGIAFEKRYFNHESKFNHGMTLESVLINFGYKQLTCLWRMKAMLKLFSKAPNWGEKPRSEISLPLC